MILSYIFVVILGESLASIGTHEYTPLLRCTISTPFLELPSPYSNETLYFMQSRVPGWPCTSLSKGKNISAGQDLANSAVCSLHNMGQWTVLSLILLNVSVSAQNILFGAASENRLYAIVFHARLDSYNQFYCPKEM